MNASHPIHPTRMSAKELSDTIRALRRFAETGEQWAEICWLESLLVAK